MKCNAEKLEALVDGGLSPEEAAEVQTHAAACADCGEELRWLRSERELMRRRAARDPLPADLWSGVEARLHATPARSWARPLGFSTAVAAAAVLAFLGGRHAAERANPRAPVEVTQAPAARYRTVSMSTTDNDVIDQAEEEWRRAAGELEGLYFKERGRLRGREAEPIEEAMEEARRSIAEARRLAGRDVDARVAVLHSYSNYVQSLHTVVSNLEVVR
jgi:hypothetical protein